MELNEILSAILQMEHLKEIRRQGETRALGAPEAAGAIFQQYPGGFTPGAGLERPTGPDLASTIGSFPTGTNPTGIVNLPGVQEPGQVPFPVEDAFQKEFDVPLRKLGGTLTKTDQALEASKRETPILLDRERQGLPIDEARAETAAEIGLKKQKAYADYIKKLYPERSPLAKEERTRENALFDDLFRIENWHSDQMHAIRQDPRTTKNPEQMKAFVQEQNRTLLEKVRALEHQYPDLLTNPKIRKQISKVKALSIISPLTIPNKK